MLKDKKVIVVGLAKSGVSAIALLHHLGAKITCTDIKDETQLGDLVDEVKPFVASAFYGYHPDDVSSYDLAVISPGIPLDIPFVKNLKNNGIEIIGEVELAYRFSKGQFVGITGTNGKTTTTALTGMIFDLSGKKAFTVGNIGVPVASKALESDERTTFVTELSSFQLETIVDFKAHIAAILNLTPDHLNRHKTMAGYSEAKMRIFENQTAADFLILNFDDLETREMGAHAKGRKLYFSRVNVEIEGAFIESGWIRIRFDGSIVDICEVKDMKIFGSHNEENALAASLICYLAGIDVTTIALGLKTFAGVEHRIEFTAEISGVKYYNDSKGTNPDSTIKAIQAMTAKTYLIAGGYDKKSEFAPMFDVFGDTIKHLILLGATKEILKREALNHGFEQITCVNSMEEAVAFAHKNALSGEVVLLSPACASWDMYDNFEQRGEHFKKCVLELK
ncbi:MAG: UDP-N-acetylmuramoylalanine--D-glutamate ligase [Clostridiales bacterium 38-18]|nr:MAG: UDP-N-acetylmuramoylalanine--D-glutamate ligase [Clostridiales bacterium 38-18]